MAAELNHIELVIHHHAYGSILSKHDAVGFAEQFRLAPGFGRRGSFRFGGLGGPGTAGAMTPGAVTSRGAITPRPALSPGRWVKAILR